MRALVLALSIAACGRFDFGAYSPDGGAGDAPAEMPPPPPSLIHSANGAAASSTLGVTIAPTTAGHFLLVGIVTYSNNPVTSVVDDAGNTYASAGARGVITAGGGTEIWFARSVAAGATKVTITVSGGGLEAWVAELSGIDANPIDAKIASDQNSGATVIAPSVTTTAPNALVLSVGAIVNGAKGIHAPFVSLGIPNGDIAGYFIAPVPGSYGAVFDETSSGLTCASSAAFPAGAN